MFIQISHIACQEEESLTMFLSLDCGKLFDLDFGLISIDQEKAFYRIEHVLKAFEFSSDFISMINVMYFCIVSILKINGDLCSLF